MKAIYAVPGTIALCYRAWSHQSLTPLGIVAAALTAVAHAVHPWNLPFVLLVVFYLAGTRATKVKKDVKEHLTLRAGGTSGGEGPRTHIQVLANSIVASILSLLHAYQLHSREQQGVHDNCYPWGGDLLVVGIIANYAVTAADTFSSELGILSNTEPRLITSLNFRKVPRGTNGGVTAWGLVAGLLGSLVVVTASLIFTPFCSPVSNGSGLAGGLGWGLTERQWFAYSMAIWGLLGSVMDSLLGGWFQHSVVDTKSGRIVEGEGGKRVLASTDIEGKEVLAKTSGVQVSESKVVGRTTAKNQAKPSFGAEKPSRVVASGLGVLDNNQVNLLMAVIMSGGAMLVASWAWDVPLSSVIPR